MGSDLDAQASPLWAQALLASASLGSGLYGL